MTSIVPTPIAQNPVPTRMPTPTSVKCTIETQCEYINVNNDGISPACADNAVVKYNLYVTVVCGNRMLFRQIFYNIIVFKVLYIHQ